MEKSFKPTFTKIDLKVQLPYSQSYQEKRLGIKCENRLTSFRQIIEAVNGRFIKNFPNTKQND